MKRDWDLLRKQLTTIEEENNHLADIPEEPKWLDQSEEDYQQQYENYRAIESRIGGHLELLINGGYVEGLHVLRSVDGQFSFGLSAPRLTMAGHDLLETMRSATIWESIKSSAKKKGIELTFDAIKVLSTAALKHVVSSA